MHMDAVHAEPDRCPLTPRSGPRGGMRTLALAHSRRSVMRKKSGSMAVCLTRERLAWRCACARHTAMRQEYVLKTQICTPLAHSRAC